MKALLLAGWFACTPGQGSDKDGASDSGAVDTREDSGSQDTGEVKGFQSAAVCGECHIRQYEEWRGSMHAYAALSPVFDRMAAKAHRDTSGEVGTFCTGCHAPLGTREGELGSTVSAQRSELSREGVTCEVCHTAVAHTTPVGNTGLILNPLAPKQGPYVSDATEGHTNSASELSVAPELCGSCHDVFNFPGLYIEEAYSEYLTSPAKQENQRCQDCHMGPEPGVVSDREFGQSAEGAEQEYPDRELATHRFVGPDYSLLDGFPFPDDLDASATAQEEYAEQVLVLLQNAVEIDDLEVQAIGSQMAVTVKVKSLTMGHNVPTGFTSERQLWLEVTVTGQSGTVYFQSGNLDSYGDLRDPHSWDVKAGTVSLDVQLFNAQSENLHRYGSQDEIFGEVGGLELTETVFPFDADFIAKRSLTPGEVREVRYSLNGLTEPAEVLVRLRYRNLPPYILRALQLDGIVDRLRIFDIDTEVAQVQ